LPARYVIHTVGPVYGSGGAGKADLLAACYFNSMSLATLYELNSIAFPAISTGIYGYPQAEAAVVSSRTIEHFLSGNNSIGFINLVFFSADDAAVFLQQQVFSG
jgi:O-acetyl-ADP-ribose deacetylase (regulator of RNase III)